MFGRSKHSPRRQAIREDRPDSFRVAVQRWKDGGLHTSVLIALTFAVIASGILTLRQEVLEFRPGQYVAHDIVSRVDFNYHDAEKLLNVREESAERTPRIYKQVAVDSLARLEELLLTLPDEVTGATPESLPQPLAELFEGDKTALTRLQQIATGPQRRAYDENVTAYIAALRKRGMIILPEEQRREDRRREIELRPVDLSDPVQSVDSRTTYPFPLPEAAEKAIEAEVFKNFLSELQPKMISLTKDALGPTHVYDPAATGEARNLAAASVPKSAGDVYIARNERLIKAGNIEPGHWQLLKSEHDAFVSQVGNGWKRYAGTTAIVFILTLVLGVYVATFQKKIVKNHARAAAIAALLLAMLLLAQLAGLSQGTVYLAGVAPTILVAMILAIAYDRRFALGVASIHGLLVTVALDQDIQFYLILFSGVLVCCYLLDDIRTRNKLIEVGGATALTLIATTVATGLLNLDPLTFILRNSLYTGAAGLIVGFFVFGILPTIEKVFRMTTSMTLLELADVSHPLMRRLSMEAPGTYNHSIQVATLAEEASESINANALLCRVAAYYHDVGKINKAEYFIENQAGGENRHINLSPSVSLLIIIGHVKDGIELAKEYNLPTSIHPFIQQHHGTTLVEYFYNQACKECPEDQPAISETQYRYPGPKPRSKEVAVLMLSDACESACRTLRDFNAGRIEALVRDITHKRLEDGQFDDSDLTIGEMETIQMSMIKTLQGIYHGRIAYPSTAGVALSVEVPQQTAKTA